ncbi:hypothetical protein [Bacillus thuringiensis]|uniref:hypothetical protein n=1 Tax=Bacillus thuringiensis TaxID=1428 RepID=UPI00115550B1|nr:hypothetical protein [Bacillus thuringiensis]
MAYLGMPFRVKKYINSIIGQDHDLIKKRIQNMLELKSIANSYKMIARTEAIPRHFNTPTRQDSSIHSLIQYNACFSGLP